MTAGTRMTAAPAVIRRREAAPWLLAGARGSG
ncbi:hypothetical protein JOF59_005441 [Streptomyces clavifer]|uniref:Uncharacterized protein n=1 Tax=Streptomyces clavifer TaxID=68188 RepID=A0ABS4VGV7_9ACTN|nr:hypothetical protein [Streptomyces clavifer]